MDYYKILGVSPQAEQKEIKSAYRKLAAIHHPDKGGDTSKFQSLSEAYQVLGNVDSRAMYDNQFTVPPFNSNRAADAFADMFRNSRYTHQHTQARQRARKNRDLSIRIRIDFAKSYTGAELNTVYQTPSGKKESAIIKIPPGVQSGQTIKYTGLGDDSDKSLPRGDLKVTIVVEKDQNYDRRGNELLVYVLIDPFEAILGCTKTVEHVDGSKFNIMIRPGVQHGTEYVTKGLGFNAVSNGSAKGNLVTVIGIKVPVISDNKIKNKIRDIQNEINK